MVGGGVEFLSWDRWLLRGEYLFHHFNGASAVGGAANFPTFPSGFTWSGVSTSTNFARAELQVLTRTDADLAIRLG